ncbi:uncharacterized protein LOC126792110 [Argentina anserina]|uniref:uncharacterized protein LOC126792110 n=1 Tax=Argentina anserina TaxID=57926 RepID=UPI00217658C0|nr:uncharacterized protein LOC126792110 [Potentilla anserina]
MPWACTWFLIDMEKSGNICFRMTVTSLSCICRFQYVNRIRVRVNRSWRSKRYQNNAFDGMHYFLIDEKSDSIHVVVDEHDYAHTTTMKDGCLYDIFHVHVKSSSNGYKVVDNDVEIGFNEMFKIVLLKDDSCPILKYICHFLPFSEVEKCFNDQQKLECEKKIVLLAGSTSPVTKLLLGRPSLELIRMNHGKQSWIFVC